MRPGSDARSWLPSLDGETLEMFAGQPDWIRQKKYPFGCYIFELLAAQSFLKRSIELLVASGGRRARARRDYRGAAEGELS